MIGARTYRGQPLVALLMLLAGWVVVRVIVSEGASVSKLATPPALAVAPVPARLAEARHSATAGPVRPDLTPPRLREPQLRTRFVPPRSRDASPVAVFAGHDASPVPIGQPWAARGVPAPARSATPVLRDGAPARSSWSADGWLLIRDGSGAPLVGGAAPATYGASQAGVVLRYRLASDDARRPAAYLRATAALGSTREQEAALGLSVRPLPALRLVVAGELRAARQAGSMALRPAAFAYTELAPIALAQGFTAEIYAQAGYVGGRFATAFADGQLHVDRPVAHLGAAELRAGGGVWSGAQKGVSRLDAGPAATLGIAGSGAGAARLGVDWRFRLAGNAAPASGPALTLSAGF